MIGRLLALLCALLTFGALGDADAATGRMRLARSAGAPPTSDLPAVQTVYWGPNTLNGHGGYNVCINAQTNWVNACVGAVEVTASANFTEDATYDGLVVPKNGSGSNTYGGSRTTPLSGSESVTIRTASGQVSTIINVVDAARAGDFTVRDRDSDTSGTLATVQLAAALRAAPYGATVAFRDGSRLNTLATPGANLDGQTSYGLRCGNCDTSGFDGSNYKVIRPETGGKATLGNITVDGQTNRIRGWRFEGLTFADAANTQYTYRLRGQTGASDIQVWNSTFIGKPDTVYGTDTPRGILVTSDALRWHIKGNTFAYLEYGLAITQPAGDPATDNYIGSTSPSDGHYVGYNLFREIGADVVQWTCLARSTFEYNVSTDKRLSVNVSPTINPFDTTNQPHGDHFQISGDKCVYNRYPDVVLRGNFLLRGQGRDTLPFWTVPPYSNPNLSGGIKAGSIEATPNVNFGLGSAQGFFMSHGWPGEPLVGGSTRVGGMVMANLIVQDNVVMTEYLNGMAISYSENPTVTGNIVISTRPGPINLETGAGFGSTRISLRNITGTSGVIARNVSGIVPEIEVAEGGSVSQSGNVTAGRVSLGAFFQNPSANGSPRSIEEFRAAYLPIEGGPLMVAPGVYAGPYCPNGALQTGAPCH